MDDRRPLGLAHHRITMEEKPQHPYRFGDFEEFEQRPELATPDDLNNLHLWLPRSGYRAFFERGDMFDENIPGLRQGKTIREFFDDVEATVRELPAEERENIERLDAQRTATDVGIDEHHCLTTELNRVLVPLYRALRAKGYSHRDLVT
ncbi:MAG TPA: hypothetical protein VJ553_05205 [Candidatus Paceibacterota bacterium]|nr:hypothetical protein [Candidatus Paceibacterota bacterium]